MREIAEGLFPSMEDPREERREKGVISLL